MKFRSDGCAGIFRVIAQLVEVDRLDDAVLLRRKLGEVFADQPSPAVRRDARQVSTHETNAGVAVLLGGAHGTMALARSLRQAGVEVWFITDAISIASFSSAMSRIVRWAGPGHPDAVGTLESIAQKHSLEGSILIPAADAEVRLVAQAHDRLSAVFTVMTTAWDRLRWSCDKSLAYKRAAHLRIGVPRVYEPADFEDPSKLHFPLVIKPATWLERNEFTKAKAWRVDDWGAFAWRYQRACELAGVHNLVVQELIPGGGEHQLSYAAVWDRGEPVASFTARRLRQYPAEFGFASTFVQTAAMVDVTSAAETFLRSVDHHGLVEVEFKRDPRDGMVKLLDINPRPWTWFALASAAGVDLGAAIACMASGRRLPHVQAREGIAWISVARDLFSLAQTARSAAPVRNYARSLGAVRTFAAFSRSDPLPALAEPPLMLVRILNRHLQAMGK